MKGINQSLIMHLQAVCPANIFNMVLYWVQMRVCALLVNILASGESERRPIFTRPEQEVSLIQVPFQYDFSFDTIDIMITTAQSIILILNNRHDYINSFSHYVHTHTRNCKKVFFKVGMKQKLRTSFFPIELKTMRACELKKKNIFNKYCRIS